MMDVIMTQHPVGQGGMMSGLLKVPGGRFHWVYDCGSNQAEALGREIAAIGARGEIDCLFLSHLDSDHISGIDRLLVASGGVKEVVLPYLDDIDRLIVAAHDSATGRLTGELLTFLGDMARWFGTRGVDRVTFISPRSDDDDPEMPSPEFPRGGEPDKGKGEIFAKWSQTSDRQPVRKGRIANLPKRILVQRLQTTSMLDLGSSWGSLGWIFAPYAHRPSEKKFCAFNSDLFKQFGRHYRTPGFLAALLHDKSKLRALREAYDLIWSDHNLVSMALYAGPVDSSAWSRECLHPPDWWHQHPEKQAVGWLGTGDMHLNGVRRRAAMINHYRYLLDQVNVFALPHHGSHRNYHPSLPHEMPNMTQCVAASGPNGYGHPSDTVKQSVLSAGREFVRVSDKGRSVLQWRHLR